MKIILILIQSLHVNIISTDLKDLLLHQIESQSYSLFVYFRAKYENIITLYLNFTFIFFI